MLRGQTGTKLALTFTKEGVNLSRLRAARFREALLDSSVKDRALSGTFGLFVSS
jgi:hypothetical protein